MSDRRLAVAVALAIGASGSLSAQADLPSLRERRDQLVARRRVLANEVRAQEIAARDSNLRVVVRAGTLVLRTTPAIAPVAKAVMTATLERAQRTLGDDADSLTSRMEFTLREMRPNLRYERGPWGVGGALALARDIGPTGAQLAATFEGTVLSGVLLSWPVAGSDLTNALLAAFERASGKQLTAPIGAWLEQAVPLQAAPPTLWTDLYRALATSNAAVARHCVGGSLSACRLALAIDSMPVDRVAAWYDESDFPDLAKSAGDNMGRVTLNRMLSEDEQAQCTREGRIDVCRRMLAMLAPSAFGVPASASARASLFRVAMERGGAGAFARVRASTAPTVGARLSDAARLPVDTIVAHWQQRVVAGRPRSPLPNATFVLTSTACILLCGAWASRGQPWT